MTNTKCRVPRQVGRIEPDLHRLERLKVVGGGNAIQWKRRLLHQHFGEVYRVATASFLEAAVVKPSLSLLVSKSGGVFRAFGLPGEVILLWDPRNIELDKASEVVDEVVTS